MSVAVNLSNMQKLLREAKRLAHNRVNIGITDAVVGKYAPYVEFGWVQGVTSKQWGWFRAHGITLHTQTLYNPPRPFMRATFQANAKEWMKVASKQFKLTYDGTGDFGTAVNTFLKTAGVLGVDAITNTIATGGASYGFPRRSELTLKLYQAMGGSVWAGSKSLTKTGELESSIGFELSNGDL